MPSSARHKNRPRPSPSKPSSMSKLSRLLCQSHGRFERSQYPRLHQWRHLLWMLTSRWVPMELSQLRSWLPALKQLCLSRQLPQTLPSSLPFKFRQNRNLPLLPPLSLRSLQPNQPSMSRSSSKRHRPLLQRLHRLPEVDHNPVGVSATVSASLVRL